MVKAYLRYEFGGAFGVISSNSNIVYDATGKHFIASGLENINLWNIKQGSLVRACFECATCWVVLSQTSPASLACQAPTRP